MTEPRDGLLNGALIRCGANYAKHKGNLKVWVGSFAGGWPFPLSTWSRST